MKPSLFDQHSAKSTKRWKSGLPPWLRPNKSQTFKPHSWPTKTPYKTDTIEAATIFGTPLGKGRFTVRLADSDSEIVMAQTMRHRIFLGQTSQSTKSDNPEPNNRDCDALDQYCDHLIVLDQQAGERMVGVCRLIRQHAAERAGRFYSAGSYDLTTLLSYPGTLVEVGRSCIDPAYRDGAVSRILWKGLSRYIANFNIDLMFGCASLPGTQRQSLAESLSYLHYYHSASKSLRPGALSALRVAMDIIPYDQIDPKKAFSQLPPLIKAYLRIGGSVGDGAVIDHDFGTIDVLMIVQTAALATRYRLMGLERPKNPSKFSILGSLYQRRDRYGP